MADNAGLFSRANEVIPGGVDSPVRAFGAVGGTPYFVARAEGMHVWDVEGRRYTDYVQSWGASILGHAHPKVVEAVQAAAADGTSFGAPTEREVLLAEAIRARVPSCERVRLVSSGTEATMTALRIARGFTGRDRIVKFAGCYHGHSDALLAEAGSGVATLGLPGSAGVTKASVADTVVAPYNVVPEIAGDVAAVIVEPVAANMGVVAPAPGFLDGLRAACDAAGALLIFDEVITGFRLGLGGAQGAYRVTPDLSCFGKVIGGGLPLAAVGGRADVMSVLAPDGPVYQAGTLSGNPLATAAGLAVLDQLDDGVYVQLAGRAEQLGGWLADVIAEAGLPVHVTVVGPLLTVFFADEVPVDYAGAKRADTKLYARFFHEMLDRGVALPPSQFEAMFPSLAHTKDELERTADLAAAAAARASSAILRGRLPVAALFAAVVAYVYRPWAMTSRLPRNTGDTSFVTFTMAWVSHSITHPRRLFDAPIFFPHHNTLAYSDPLLPLGPVWGVVHWISGNWTIATGMVVMAMVVGNLAATYALARRLTGRADAAALAAFAFALSDFALAQWGHIQMQALGFLPLGFLLLLRLLERGRWTDGLLLGLVQGAMALTTASIALAWAVAAVAAIAAHLVIRRFRIDGAVWKAMALTAVVSAVLVVPATRPYTDLQRDKNFKRPLQPLASFRWPDLLSPTRDRHDVLHRVQAAPVRHHGAEHEAFPGRTALALAVVGLAGLAVMRRRPDPRRHELLLVTVAGVVCLVTAMGPDVLGPLSPYRVLHNDVPGFAGLRVATRFTTVTILAVAVLAASGLASLVARFRRPQLARTVGWAAVALLLVELAMPVRWRHLDTDRATLAVYRELAKRPAGPVAELPMASFLDASTWSDVEAPRQVYLTLDWHPRVNGYSGFVTPDYFENLTFLNRFPDPCAIYQARKIGVRWIIVHTGVVDRIRQYDPLETARTMAGLPKDAVTRAGRSYLIDVTRLPSPTC